MEGDLGGVEKFLTNKGVEIFKKTLAKKGLISERGFKELVPPFKEEIERRGWELLCKHLEPTRNSRQRVLCELGGQEEPDLLCQRGMAAFWREGPFTMVQAQGRGRLLRV